MMVMQREVIIGNEAGGDACGLLVKDIWLTIGSLRVRFQAARCVLLKDAIF